MTSFDERSHNVIRRLRLGAPGRSHGKAEKRAGRSPSTTVWKKAGSFFARKKWKLNYPSSGSSPGSASPDSRLLQKAR
jgi:hypothetical protein